MSRLSIEIATDYNAAGFKEASENAKTFGVTVEQVAAKNIERTTQQKVRLQELATQYKLVAASAKEGSAEQVAALDLAAKAQKRLGGEVIAMNSAVRTSARETALAEKELAKFTRGAAEATGTFGKLGLGLALGSGGFIAGAALTGGVKKAIDDAKALMDAEEQLGVAVKNTGQSLNTRQLDAYLKSESDLSLFTKTDLVANLVQLERTTGSVTKAQQDEKLAANLARGAHIDLATATQDLIGLEGGRTRGLVTLGVKVPIIKTAQDALTESGKKFTAQQHAEAAALDKAATAAEGKRILMERYANSSKTFAESDASSTEKLTRAESLLGTSIGTVLLPAVQEIATPFAKWAQHEADSGDAAKKTKEIVGDLTGVLKTAKGVIHDVDDVTGSFKHTLELLGALKVGSMIAGWTGAFKTLAGAEALGGAATEAKGLYGSMALLKGLGVVAVTLLVTEKTQGGAKGLGEKAAAPVEKFLKDHAAPKFLQHFFDPNYDNSGKYIGPPPMTGLEGAGLLGSTVGAVGMSAAQKRAYIAAQAAALGLDPRAVLGVATAEGGFGGAVGDGGHAYGPFQLNNAGGVITGKFPGKNSGAAQSFANSQAGIDFALKAMAKVAGGLKGMAAIDAIVSGFERPKNSQHDLSTASAYYFGTSGADAGTNSQAKALAAILAAGTKKSQVATGCTLLPLPVLPKTPTKKKTELVPA